MRRLGLFSLLRWVIAVVSICAGTPVSGRADADDAGASCVSQEHLSLLQHGMSLRSEQIAKSQPALRIPHRPVQCQEEPSLDAAFQRFDASGVRLHEAHLHRQWTTENIGLRFAFRNKTVQAQFYEGSFWCTFQDGIQVFYENYLAMFQAVADEVDLPDMDFVLSMFDQAHGGAGVLKTEGIAGEDLLMVPRSLQSTDGFFQSWLPDEIVPKCATKKPLAVFRGAATGGCATWSEKPGVKNLPLLDNYSQILPRYEIAALGKRRPDLIDAGLTSSGCYAPAEKFEEALRQEGLLREQLTYEEQHCYSAIIVADGQSLPDRLPEQLSWGLPVIFIRNKVGLNGARVTDEFWYKELTPWEHYVPATPETLESVLRTLLTNSTLARHIGSRGKQYIIEKLNKDRLKCYVTKLLQEYSKRFTRDLAGRALRPLPSENEAEVLTADGVIADPAVCNATCFSLKEELDANKSATVYDVAQKRSSCYASK